MIELFGSALVTFLVIIDPPGCAPIFASLTRGASAAHRRAMAIRSSLIAWGILMFFALLGEPMLHALGISLASFRIAGGIMLFIIAARHGVRAAHRAPREARPVDRGDARGRGHQRVPDGDPDDRRAGIDRQRDAVGVARRQTRSRSLIVLAAITVVILMTMATLLAAGPLMRLIGERIEAMITRILGVILAALAAQFVVDGLKQSFPALG